MAVPLVSGRVLLWRPTYQVERRRGAARRCRGGKRDAMCMRAVERDEGVAGFDATRIERESAHDDVAGRIRIGMAVEQFAQGHRTRVRHGVATSAMLPSASESGSTFCGGAGTLGGGVGPPTYQLLTLSGGTSSRRSAPSMTFANTGAETKPPA